MRREKNKTERQPRLPVRIWRSIFRGPIAPRNDRERKWVVLNNLILHFRPVSLPKKTLQYTHTWGLGGMCLVLFVVLAATGVLLMFVYEPSPDRAYPSMVSLQQDVFFGKLVRNIHHWSANFLIAIVILHLLRVTFTNAYDPPRQFNWVIGLTLLLAILAANFTGYLLPWDQLSYWAITISTGMIATLPGIGEWLQGMIRGGPEIGSATIINFYTFHTTLIPVSLITLMAFHFWRVRKAHGVVIPRAPDESPQSEPEYVLTLPNLLVRELAVASILVAFVLVFSVSIDAPLGAEANPGMSPNPAKAPWYFVGLQELLIHFHPLFAVGIIPLMVITTLFLIPYIRYDSETSGGVFLISRKGRRMGAIAALTALLVTPCGIILDELWIGPVAWFPGLPPEVANGLLPTSLCLAALVSYHIYLKKRFGASRSEAVQASFIFLSVVFVVLTVTGVWFRGSGMALAWPWNM